MIFRPLLKTGLSMAEILVRVKILMKLLIIYLYTTCQVWEQRYSTRDLYYLISTLVKLDKLLDFCVQFLQKILPHFTENLWPTSNHIMATETCKSSDQKEVVLIVRKMKEE